MKTLLIFAAVAALTLESMGAGWIAPPKAYDIFDRALTRKHGTNMTLWGVTNRFSGANASNVLTFASGDVGSGALPVLNINGVGFMLLRQDSGARAIYIGASTSYDSRNWDAITFDVNSVADGGLLPRHTFGYLDDGQQIAGFRMVGTAINDIHIESFTDTTSLSGGSRFYQSDSSGNQIIGDAIWPTILRGSPTVSSRSNLVASAAFATTPATVALTADNQVIDTAHDSYIQISSDNATAANRTFVLKGGASMVSGQRLTLEWTGTNAGELVDDSAANTSGNHRLSATWTPTQYDTLTLIFNGTDWVESARATN